jgi:ATP-dependent exoDNAse (exonuclease V) beta subunit
LRTLYVACTRAEDYLILSAGLASSLDVQSPWMQTLSERFDIRTGECLVGGHTCKARVLGSAVGVELDAAPLVPPPRPEGARRKGTPEPIPIRAASQVLFAVEELEAILEGSSPEALSSVRQHDAEDDSDRAEWPTHRDRLGFMGQASTRDRVLRVVLQHGSGNDPAQWQPLLRRTAERLGLPVEESRELEESLERLLNPPTFARVWRAELLRVESPFTLEWPGKRLPRGMKQRPIIQGVIDLLWREDKDGGLLWLTTEPLPAHEWPHPGRIFWVHAYHQLTGAWPRRVDAYSLADGSYREESGQSWRASDLIDRFHEALAARLRESTAR